jgi:hypothetical protein
MDTARPTIGTRNISKDLPINKNTIKMPTTTTSAIESRRFVVPILSYKTPEIAEEKVSSLERSLRTRSNNSGGIE